MKISNPRRPGAHKNLSAKTKHGGGEYKQDNSDDEHAVADGKSDAAGQRQDQSEVTGRQSLVGKELSGNTDSHHDATWLQSNRREPSAIEADRHHREPPGQQKKQQIPGRTVNYSAAFQNGGATQGYATYPAASSLLSSASYPSSAGYYGYSPWVRIPYPLSSFIPPVATPVPVPSLPAEHAGNDDEHTGLTHTTRNHEATGGNKKEPGNQTTAGYWYGGFGMAELRDSNVDILNEAGDALWKAGKKTRGTHSDSEDL